MVFAVPANTDLRRALCSDQESLRHHHGGTNAPAPGNVHTNENHVIFCIRRKLLIPAKWLTRKETARGEVAEWFKAAVLKTVEVERLPGVRIPLSPPI